MNAIVAVNSDWGIGYNNTQTIVIPEDRRHFQKLTSGGIVIAGRKTFEDFGKPLPDRKNIILTRDKGFNPNGAIIAHSVEQVLAIIALEDTEKVFVIGGGSIYNAFLHMCEYAYITAIEASPPSDIYFPNLNDAPGWQLIERSEVRQHNSLRYTYDRYKNTSALATRNTDERK